MATQPKLTPVSDPGEPFYKNRNVVWGLVTVILGWQFSDVPKGWNRGEHGEEQRTDRRERLQKLENGQARTLRH